MFTSTEYASSLFTILEEIVITNKIFLHKYYR